MIKKFSKLGANYKFRYFNLFGNKYEGLELIYLLSLYLSVTKSHHVR
jgi:hypothetical protein